MNTLVRDVKTLREDMKHLLRLNGEKENIEIEEGHIHFSTYEELAEFDKRLDDGEVFKRAVSKNITIRKFCRDFSTYYLSYYFFIYSVDHLNQKLSSIHLLVFDIFCVSVIKVWSHWRQRLWG